MALFNEVEAKHFFSTVTAPSPSSVSFRDWSNSLPMGSLSTGSSVFEELRAQSFREVERLLLLSASHYRRAHDCLSPISSPWAFVTLYYGSFFAATALMGALGAWKLRGNVVLQVMHTSPPVQRFAVHKVTSTYNGSHEKFWEFYFNNSASLIASASGAERFSLSAISADVTWLTARRNDFNYDSFAACELAELHKKNFSVAGFPASLPGALNTQFRFLESLLTIANRVAKSVGIDSDAVSLLSSSPTRSQRVKDLVFKDVPPGMAAKVKRKTATG